MQVFYAIQDLNELTDAINLVPTPVNNKWITVLHIGKEIAMSKTDTKGKQGHKPEDDEEELEDMELLERLETLREDMDDLGVTTLQEVIERINALHHKLDQD
jgi:hypothetical protein